MKNASSGKRARSCTSYVMHTPIPPWLALGYVEGQVAGHTVVDVCARFWSTSNHFPRFLHLICTTPSLVLVSFYCHQINSCLEPFRRISVRSRALESGIRSCGVPSNLQPTHFLSRDHTPKTWRSEDHLGIVRFTLRKKKAITGSCLASHST